MPLRRKVLPLAFFLFSFTQTISAQSGDNTFVDNYKTFRDITDSLKSYALYLVPYGSSKKIRLTGTYQNRLSKVYHFLKRNKEIDFKNPDFIIGILIDEQKIDEPEILPDGKFGNYDKYIIKVTYHYKVNFLIHTKERKELRFNLGGDIVHEKTMVANTPFNEIRDSISRNGYSLRPQPQPITVAQSQTPMYAHLHMQEEDYKTLLSKLLDKFINYYVDRVDN